MELFIFARFHSREGLEDEVRRVIEIVLQETRKEPGCLSIGLFGSLSDKRLFFIHSRWRDEAAFDAHAELPHTRAFLDAVTPLLDHELDVVRSRLVS